MESYYQTLNISHNASPDEIKKQYRKLSLLHHPDRPCGNNELFKKISEAYEGLSDPNKKQMYDMRFKNVDLPVDKVVEPNVRTPLLTIQLEITFEQSYSGCSKPIKLERVVNQTVETETIYVDVPRGIDDNEVIIIPNKGHHGVHGMGDLKICIRLLKHETFTRNGMDLYYEHILTLKESLCGFMFDFEHLNGKQIKINNSELNTIIHPRYKKIIPNLGVVRNTSCGNLIITFNIMYPILTDHQITHLRGIL
jgi:curved DNA-binding protein